jgi:hypothetical protein
MFNTTPIKDALANKIFFIIISEYFIYYLLFKIIPHDRSIWQNLALIGQDLYQPELDYFDLTEHLPLNL